MTVGQLRIFLANADVDDEEEIAAEHDELFVGGPSPVNLPEATVFLLKRTGWIWSDEFDCWRHYT